MARKKSAGVQSVQQARASDLAEEGAQGSFYLKKPPMPGWEANFKD
jgi:hypothetical protein